MSRRIRKYLCCGCCGAGFDRWEGYIDQDQDQGYGICKDCQGIIEAKNVEAMDRAIDVLANGLNDTNKAKLRSASRMRQELLVHFAFEDGIIGWHIRKSN